MPKPLLIKDSKNNAKNYGPYSVLFLVSKVIDVNILRARKLS